MLLIGDSISIGYTLAVRELLQGVANVHRPPTNCGPTLRGLANLEAWLGDKPWDVIHFNWGLHDLKYIVPNSEPRHSGRLVAVEDGEQMMPLETYAENMARLVRQLKKTGAALTWCATTPIPQGARGRVPGDAARYNEAAATVMRQRGVPINDLYHFAFSRLSSIQRKADVHFTSEGSRVLAEEVVRHVLPQLPLRAQIARAQSWLTPPRATPTQGSLPELLGKPRPHQDQWPARRAALCDQLAFYEYGFAPPLPTRLRFQVLREDQRALGGKATKREVRVHFGPETTPTFDLLLYVPNQRPGPAPVFLGLNFHGNQTVTDNPEVSITTSWVPERGKGVEDNRATAASRGTSAHWR